MLEEQYRYVQFDRAPKIVPYFWFTSTIFIDCINYVQNRPISYGLEKNN